MKDERMVIFLSVLCAALLWVFNSLSDSLFLSKETFLNLTMLHIPLVTFVNGGVTFVLLITFGYIVSRIIVRAKKNEEEAQRLAAIVHHAGEAVLRISPDGVVQNWNPGSEDIFGYSAEEMIGKSISVLFPKEIPTEILGMIEKGGRANRHELALARKDGKRIIVSASISPMKDSENKVCGASIIAADITTVRENEQKTDTARREQERFMRHELKNTLVPIRGYAELLQVAVPEGMTPTQITYIKRILEGTSRAINLIDSLKKLQDIESGAYELERVEFPLETIIRDAISDLSQVADKNGVVMDCVCREENLTGLFDLNLMPGVFHNLIKNSIEHVSMCGNPEEKKLRVTLYREDKTAVVKIHNRGAPLPTEKLATFFEKFNTDKKKKAYGTGLGTTYAYLVTLAHGGTITVESNETDGTTVTLRLDLHPGTYPS